MKYPLPSLHLLSILISLSLSVLVCADTPLFQISAVAESANPAAKTFTLKHKDSTESVAVELPAWLDDTAIKSAEVKTNPDGTPSILITLTETATKRWGELTTKYTG